MTADTRLATRSRCGVMWVGDGCPALEDEYVWPPVPDDHHYCTEQIHEPEAGFIVHACRCGAELPEPVA